MSTDRERLAGLLGNPYASTREVIELAASLVSEVAEAHARVVRLTETMRSLSAMGWEDDCPRMEAMIRAHIAAVHRRGVLIHRAAGQDLRKPGQ